MQYHVRMIFNKFGVDCREMLFAKLIRTLCATMSDPNDHDEDTVSKALKALDDAAKKYKSNHKKDKQDRREKGEKTEGGPADDVSHKWRSKGTQA